MFEQDKLSPKCYPRMLASLLHRCSCSGEESRPKIRGLLQVIEDLRSFSMLKYLLGPLSCGQRRCLERRRSKVSAERDQVPHGGHPNARTR